MAAGGEVKLSNEDFQRNLEDQNDEVMALESIFADTECLHVMSTPDSEDGTYNLQIYIKVKSEREETVIDAWMPYQQEADLPQTSANIPANSKPEFQRSESGRRWHSSFPVKHLTPLCLQVTLPQSYPAEGAPVFTLSCLWLDALQLTCLCRQLDALWGEAAGMPILYTWADWLENNTLSQLALEERVRLIPYAAEDMPDGSRDQRALPECYNLLADLETMLRYDIEQEAAEFAKSMQVCGVCFDEKQGREFYRVEECSHHFCQACTKDYCNIHVSEGTVQQLKCLDPECKVGLPYYVMRDALGEEEFLRWERLLLQKTLDTMSDIAWCPRCNVVVIAEVEKNFAQCPSCTHPFCTLCRETWHLGECELPDAKLQKLEKQSKKVSKTKTEGEKSRAAKQELLSLYTIKKTAKRCPSCKVPIQKTEGCNKVTCFLCNKCMCWLCGAAIQGYDHFQDGRCSTFTTDEDNIRNRYFVPRMVPERAEYIARRLATDVDAANFTTTCPRCKQRNLKENRNNHIKCWCCKCNFCFQCRKPMTETPLNDHFSTQTGCRQHSD